MDSIWATTYIDLSKISDKYFWTILTLNKYTRVT